MAVSLRVWCGVPMQTSMSPGAALAEAYLQNSNHIQYQGEECLALCSMGLATLPPMPRISPAFMAQKPLAVAEEATTVNYAGFAAKAIQRAKAAGLRPSAAQRPVDWAEVLYWAQRSSEPDHRWLPVEEMTPEQLIKVAPDGNGLFSILCGQHRILGGLMSGNPVPEASIITRTWTQRSMPWQPPH